ncbi:hypothetical protein [Priestia megaterium]|uniref:Uncharacterized protein n=1 Tax=Priestia megaterium TaxID=1404 RepID=A0A6M6E705_PRIMG|nr:hypothetical protein [Priestia megaterium]QJX80317.1 hypothetical protein FDZ14_29950 [Priestia megaterium]
MFSIIKVADSPARNCVLLFQEALRKIEERLESFSGMDLQFTASSNIHKPWHFKLEAPISAEIPKWMGYAAQNMTICIDVDMSLRMENTLEREATFKPTLQFRKASGELVTLDIADFGTNNIELVYDPSDVGFVFYSSIYNLLNYLKLIKEYAINIDNDVAMEIHNLIKTHRGMEDYNKDDRSNIAAALKGIIETVESHAFLKPFTPNGISVHEIIEQLKYIMNEMER